MIAVLLISLTATGLAIYSISSRPKIGSQAWEFNMKNLAGENVRLHVRSNDYAAALKSAFEARKMHNTEGVGLQDNFSFTEIYELNPVSYTKIALVWRKAEETPYSEDAYTTNS